MAIACALTTPFFLYPLAYHCPSSCIPNIPSNMKKHSSQNDLLITLVTSCHMFPKTQWLLTPLTVDIFFLAVAYKTLPSVLSIFPIPSSPASSPNTLSPVFALLKSHWTPCYSSSILYTQELWSVWVLFYGQANTLTCYSPVEVGWRYKDVSETKSNLL